MEISKAKPEDLPAATTQPQDADLPDPDAESHLPGLRLQPAESSPLPEGGGRQGGGGRHRGGAHGSIPGALHLLSVAVKSLGGAGLIESSRRPVLQLAASLQKCRASTAELCGESY